MKQQNSFADMTDMMSKEQMVGFLQRVLGRLDDETAEGLIREEAMRLVPDSEEIAETVHLIANMEPDADAAGTLLAGIEDRYSELIELLIGMGEEEAARSILLEVASGLRAAKGLLSGPCGLQSEVADFIEECVAEGRMMDTFDQGSSNGNGYVSNCGANGR